MTRLLIVGNSVSAQRSGYSSALINALRASGGTWDLMNVSLGGVGTLGLLALADRLLPTSPVDAVIIETSVSDAAGATAARDLPWVLDDLLRRILLLSPRVVLGAHLPRTDVAPAALQRVVDTQHRVFETHMVTEVDLRAAVGSDGLVDGVHLNALGAQQVAAPIARRLLDLLERSPDDGEADGSRGEPSSRFIPVGDARWNIDGAQTASFRGAMPTVRLGCLGRARFTIDDDEAVAIVAVVGPSSGVVRLADSGHQHTSQWRDEWCTVRRLQVVHIPPMLRQGPWLEVTPRTDPQARVNAWGNPSEVTSPPAVAELAGILVRPREGP